MSHYGDAVHSFYYLLMHYWLGWFGTSLPGAGAPRTPESRGCAVVHPIARKRRTAAIARV